MEQRGCKLPVIEDNEDGGSGPPLPPLILSKTVEMEIKKKAIEVAKTFRHRIEEAKYAEITPGTMCWVNSFPDEIAKVRRHDRKVGADYFRRGYTYLSATDNSREQKTCIWPDNSYSWLDESSGIMWVGVHGKDSICVVTRAGDLDLARVSGRANDWPQHVILEQFRKSVIDEIEDLTDPSSELRKKFNKSIEKPFGVVCVIPGTDESHKESGHLGYDEKEAIKFLKEAVKSDTAFSIDKTIRLFS